MGEESDRYCAPPALCGHSALTRDLRFASHGVCFSRAAVLFLGERAVVRLCDASEGRASSRIMSYVTRGHCPVVGQCFRALYATAFVPLRDWPLDSDLILPPLTLVRCRSSVTLANCYSASRKELMCTFRKLTPPIEEARPITFLGVSRDDCCYRASESKFKKFQISLASGSHYLLVIGANCNYWTMGKETVTLRKRCSIYLFELWSRVERRVNLVLYTRTVEQRAFGAAR
ncbi:unnamed protein product [Toxocara canis]|uniref:Late expression factor 12 n=1 Tax=Toxocara canis TaxID=6265 RepID=A0A183UMB0_TOXCA|nr:unnamed protein product [Toxocara canis]